MSEHGSEVGDDWENVAVLAAHAAREALNSWLAGMVTGPSDSNHADRSEQ